MNTIYDIAIIGGGVIGSAVARELSRYRLKICVLEKELDVCNGVSGRNTGLLHSGILHEYGTMRQICSMEGNAEFDKVAAELGVPFRRCGKLIVGFGPEERSRLEKLFARGLRNKVPGIRMLEKEELQKMEPEAGGDFAIWVPSAGILDPFLYTIVLAENAAENGAQYFFDQEVSGIDRQPDGTFLIRTTRDTFQSRWVINCAGIFAFRISELLGYRSYVPDRVRGQYIILDKRMGEHLHHPLYPTPNAAGAFDVHVTPTIDGNILVGPTIEHVGTELDYATTAEMIQHNGTTGSLLFPYVKRENYIRTFTGIFPTLKNPDGDSELDFQIQTDREKDPHTVNLVGITSPGLTSALPLARRVVEKVCEQEDLAAKEDFNPHHEPYVRFSHLSPEEQEKLIEQDPEYGELFCRCECVTKAEVRRAVHNILGVHTLSGIKYRTRATMGRCQGGYCQTRITQMLREDLHLKPEEVLLNQKGAYLFTGEVK